MSERGPLIYAGYTQAELDAAYTQREWADNMEVLLKQWAAAAPDVRARTHGYREVRYGAGPVEVLDVYPAGEGARFAHFHIHGGAWRGQSKSDGAFLAPLMNELRTNFIVPDFGKLPATRMPDVLQQLVAALAWTYRDQIERGVVEKLLISGHSSGAHMVALLAQQDWGALGIDPAAILGAVCISGAYDLEPVILSARGSYIDLSADEAWALSPIHHVENCRVPLHVLYGANESPEFIRQACAFSAALHGAGKLAACREIAHKNHFEILQALATAEDPSVQFLRAIIGEPDIPRASAY
ncbi:alpha/beta hydrolase [Tardiphaga sp. vice154]|uniref:alpha/beta hydrolase n=1 Tax=Tardiphaga sp. vice154 TaxID=2592814 RepID=UPI00116274E8|nr:alpha/beta hydrolase [Tardiphaga sp. vice154]QDM24121.1 alpha/beta hydrolase [Tardiphaga sp. vice154]